MDPIIWLCVLAFFVPSIAFGTAAALTEALTHRRLKEAKAEYARAMAAYRNKDKDIIA